MVFVSFNPFWESDIGLQVFGHGRLKAEVLQNYSFCNAVGEYADCVSAHSENTLKVYQRIPDYAEIFYFFCRQHPSCSKF